MILSEKMTLCNKEGTTEINRYGNCEINGDVRVEAPGFINSDCQIECSSIGAFSFINTSVIIRNTDKIGRFVMIDPGCVIGVHEHPTDFLSAHISFRMNRFFGENHFYNIASSKEFQKKYSEGEKESKKSSGRNDKINIGNDVWIGSSSIIYSGISIGDGAIIQPGSVVTADVPPYAVVGGNPATVQKMRFSDEMIEKLLEQRWWDFTPDIMEDIDFTHPTMDDLYKIEEKIMGRYPLLRCPVYHFDNNKKTVSRIGVDNSELFYTDSSGKIQKGGISDGNKGFVDPNSGTFSIHGWFLPAYTYDSVKVYIDNQFIGNACVNLPRMDVSKNEATCASPFCGWNLEEKLPMPLTSTSKGYIIVESNGKTILKRDFVIEAKKKEAR